jgi:hypothetical protein
VKVFGERAKNIEIIESSKSESRLPCLFNILRRLSKYCCPELGSRCTCTGSDNSE